MLILWRVRMRIVRMRRVRVCGGAGASSLIARANVIAAIDCITIAVSSCASEHTTARSLTSIAEAILPWINAARAGTPCNGVSCCWASRPGVWRQEQKEWDAEVHGRASRRDNHVRLHNLRQLVPSEFIHAKRPYDWNTSF